MRLVEVAAEPRGPAFEIAARPPARELLEEVLDQVLLGELLDHLDLLDPDRGLARDRAAELDPRAALGDEQPEQLAVRDERHREARAPAAARELRAELGEAERLARGPRLGIARPALELLARRVEQVDVAARAREQRSRARDHGLQQLLERVRARDRLGELGQLLELGDPPARLLVQPRVLDRAGDERRGRDEEVDLVVRELARRLGVRRDHADRRRPPRPRIGHREERLEPLLLELGHVLVRGSASALSRMNAGSPRSAAHQASPSPRSKATLPDLALVRRRRGAQHEPLAVVVDEVDEAGVDAARVGHQPDDGPQHLVELERRRDRRDDLVEELLARLQGHSRVIVGRAGAGRLSEVAAGTGRVTAVAWRQCSADCTRVALVRARLEDLRDLLDREAELVVGGEEVRPEPDPRVRPEVAEDPALLELRVHGGELGDGERSTVPPRRAGSRGLRTSKPAASARSIRSCGLAERALADPRDADLLDEVVARGRRVVRRHGFGVPVRKRAAPGAYSISSSNANGRACACQPVSVGSSVSARSGRT